MRLEAKELVDRLRATRRVDLLRVVKDAGLAARPPAPWPDAVEPYRWFLARVGDGMRLTSAGYLPPAVVAETMTALGWDADWPGSSRREDVTPPVADLRDTARRLGLVRVHRGQLRRTNAGRRLTDDPAALWGHLAARLPLTGPDLPARSAGFLWLLATAAGRARPEEWVSAAMWALGWMNGRTGEPIESWEAFSVTRDTWTVFQTLRLLERDDVPSQAAADLARAALLAEEEPAEQRPGSVPAVEFTVTLRDVDPPVWRRIAVPPKTTLRRLHGLLQAAMGWQEAHLWQFELDGVGYGDDEELELADPAGVTVGSLPEGTVFRYDYDFGDGWEHDVRVGPRLAAEAPRCVDGARACPPEDCGGPGGYGRLLHALGDPGHPEHRELTDWLGAPFDPEAFDLDTTTRRMRRRPRARR